jgi:protein tyrosine/serine phosphatase
MEPVEPRRRTPRARGLLLVILPLAAAGGGVALYDALRLPKRFAVVDEGRLYRSSQPSLRQLQRLIDDYGIRTVCIVRSGTSGRVPGEAEYARRQGLAVVHIPIDSRRPVSDAEVAEFFRCMGNEGNLPVLVHCSAGRHRTGYLCALYRIERQGWTKERALEEMLSFGFDVHDQRAVLEQLRAYRPRRPAPTGGEARAAAQPGPYGG